MSENPLPPSTNFRLFSCAIGYWLTTPAISISSFLSCVADIRVLCNRTILDWPDKTSIWQSHTHWDDLIWGVSVISLLEFLTTFLVIFASCRHALINFAALPCNRFGWWLSLSLIYIYFNITVWLPFRWRPQNWEKVPFRYSVAVTLTLAHCSCSIVNVLSLHPGLTRQAPCSLILFFTYTANQVLRTIPFHHRFWSYRTLFNNYEPVVDVRIASGTFQSRSRFLL